MARNKSRKKKPDSQTKPKDAAPQNAEKKLTAAADPAVEAKAETAAVAAVEAVETTAVEAAEAVESTDAEAAETIENEAAAADVVPDAADDSGIEAAVTETAAAVTETAAEDRPSETKESKAEKSAPKKGRKSSGSKSGEILYQVKTKKTTGMIKAFITFTYRVLHPKVSSRLVFYGILLILPGIFFFKDLYWRLFFICIGLALVLLGFFRQYISVWITKKNDPDYISGAEFTYNFRLNDGEFLKDGVRYSGLGKYKNIAGFYYDKNYLYISLTSKELLVLPKDAFTIGDADSFEEFIYKKSKKTCHWLPDNFKDKWKKRRAERSASMDQMGK